jgi:hypothetical protein
MRHPLLPALLPLPPLQFQGLCGVQAGGLVHQQRLGPIRI